MNAVDTVVADNVEVTEGESIAEGVDDVEVVSIVEGEGIAEGVDDVQTQDANNEPRDASNEPRDASNSAAGLSDDTMNALKSDFATLTEQVAWLEKLFKTKILHT